MYLHGQVHSLSYTHQENGPQRSRATCPISCSQDSNPCVSCGKASALITNVPHTVIMPPMTGGMEWPVDKSLLWDDRHLPLVAPAYSWVTMISSGPLTLPMQADRRNCREACRQQRHFLPKAKRSPAPIYKTLQQWSQEQELRKGEAHKHKMEK